MEANRILQQPGSRPVTHHSPLSPKVVCELIEGKQPPGIFAVLDDVCATMHAVKVAARILLSARSQASP